MLMTPPALAFRRSQAPARVPVLLSVPHAGRAYTARLLALARLPASALALLEDPFVDRLVDEGVAAGAAAIVASVPRAEIDLNRALDDLDPAMVTVRAPPRTSQPLSSRASFGLGLIPSRLAGHGAIWRCGLAPAEVERRIGDVYEPYHRELADTLARLRDRFGVAVLLDCHSMPLRGPAAAMVVLGDRGGVTCGEWLIAAAEAACGADRLPTARNEPYAGGEIVARHGAPADNIHAIQIELDRSLYLASDGRPDASGVARMSRLIAALVTTAAAASGPMALPLAAE